MAAQRDNQGLGEPLAGTPAHVKPRHRIAGAKFAALDPVDHGQRSDAVSAYPGIDVGSAARDIGLRPSLGPMIVGAELGKAAPVAKSKISEIADALAALLRRIHKEHAAKAFAREPAEGILLVAVDKQHGAAAVEQIERGGNPGDAAADDQDVAALHSWMRLPILQPSIKLCFRCASARLPQAAFSSQGSRSRRLVNASLSAGHQRLMQKTSIFQQFLAHEAALSGLNDPKCCRFNRQTVSVANRLCKDASHSGGS